MKTSFLAVTAAAAALLASAVAPRAALADDTLAAVRAKHVLVVGVRQDSAPYGYRKGERYLGIEPDLAHHIARDLFGDANAVRFVAVTAGDRFQALQSGKVDMLMATVSVTPERRDVFTFSRPYARTGWTLLVRAKDASVNGVADLAHKNVAVVAKTTSDGGIDRLAPQAHKIALATPAQAEEALRSGAVVAVAENVSMLQAFAKKDPHFRVVSDSYEDVGIAATCVKADSTLCGYVSREVQKYADTGALRAMYHGWVGIADTDRFYPNDPVATVP